VLPLFFKLLFLIPLFILGIYSSYTDIKSGKIFNKAIFITLVYIILLYFFLFYFSGERALVLSLITNGAKVFFISCVLWYFNLWSGGDAKLFTIFSFLIPLEFYSRSYLHYLPSFNLFVNLFIPLLFFLIINMFFVSGVDLWKKRNEIIKKKKFSYKKIIQDVLVLYFNFLFFFIIFQIIFSVFQNMIIPLNDVFRNPFFIFILLLLFMFFSKRLKEKKAFKIVFNVIIFGYLIFNILTNNYEKLVGTLKTTLFFMIFVGVTRVILNNYIQRKETRKISVNEIEEGMIIAEDGFLHFLGGFREKLGRIRADGLDRDQVLILKNFFKNSKMKIKVCKTVPFAPFMFFATLITIFTKSSFYEVMVVVFDYFRY
jgi:Flp pilus assembly protein protease CpaA